MERPIVVRAVVEYAAAGGRISNIVGFITGAADAARLRTLARLVGVSVGSVTRERERERERMASNVGISVSGGDGHEDDALLVMQLSMAEIAVGVAEGYLRLEGASGTAGGDAASVLRLEAAMRHVVHGTQDAALEMDALALLRVRVFADLWRRGHFVAFGSKFGVDFLLYEAEPSSCHSFAMVVVKDYRASFATVDLVSHCRVAKMVKKQFVLASLQNAQIVYLSLDHAVLAAAQPERR